MPEIEPWTCPECGKENPAGSRRCNCGDGFPDEVLPDSAGGHKRKSRLWIAALPGLIILALAIGGVMYQFKGFSRASKAIAPGRSTELLDCVDTYGITLHTSEFYVREGTAVWRKNNPRELSTVIKGMARNGCGKSLKNVRIRIKVRSTDGKRGDAWAEIGRLEPGQAKPFERAWMGPVNSYDIAEIR